MYTGPWVRVQKPPPSTTRIAQGFPAITKIHDDDDARALGFKAGFVGGLTLEGVVAGAIDASLGHPWYEGGIFSVRHRAPVYEGEVRVIWEETEPDPEDTRKIAFWIEHKDGERSTPGWASISRPGHKPVPPWERQPSPEPPAADKDSLPEMRIGTSRLAFKAIVTMSEAIKRLDGFNDQNWWHRIASPWGDPILTVFELGYMPYQVYSQPQQSQPNRPSRLRTPMDAGHDTVIYEPLFTDRTYLLHAWLCAKWQTERSVFFAIEYRFEDQSGKCVALMRAYSAHLIRDLGPPNDAGSSAHDN